MICPHFSRAVLKFLNKNIENFEFDKKFDLILSNEMIADLTQGIAKKENLEANKFSTEAEQLIEKYNLDLKNAPSEFLINTGAIRFIEKIQSILAEGRLAFISEYGTTGYLTIAVPMYGHYEYSIQFEHLRQVGKDQGLVTELDSLFQLLDFDKNIEILGNDSFNALGNGLLPALGFSYDPYKTLNKSSLFI